MSGHYRDRGVSFDYVPMDSTDLFSEATYATDKKQMVKHHDYPVYFLLSRRGNAMEVHISAFGREGRKALRIVGAEFLSWVPEQYPWCVMLLAPVLMPSVVNYCKKMGFCDMGVQPMDGGKTRLMVYRFGE